MKSGLDLAGSEPFFVACFQSRDSLPVPPAWTQGYARNCESALAILSFLERNFEVNNAMADAVRELCS